MRPLGKGCQLRLLLDCDWNPAVWKMTEAYFVGLFPLLLIIRKGMSHPA